MSLDDRFANSTYLQQLLASIRADRAELARIAGDGARSSSELGTSDVGIEGLLRARIDAGLAVLGRFVFQSLEEPVPDAPEPAAEPGHNDTVEVDALPEALVAAAEGRASLAPEAGHPAPRAAAEPAGRIEPPAPPPPPLAIVPAVAAEARRAASRAAAATRPARILSGPKAPAPITDELLARLKAGFGPKLERNETGPYRAIAPPDQQELKLSLKTLGRTPPNIADLRDLASELDMLDDAVSHLLTSWARLPSECNHALTSLLTCRARAAQEAAIRLGAQLEETRVNSLFPRLSRHSMDSRPGHVYGLARHHTPESGSWLEEARRWEQRVRELLGPEPAAPPNTGDHLVALTRQRLPRLLLGNAPRERQRRALKPKLTRPSSQTREVEAVPDSWPLRDLLAGRRAAIVGGDPRPEAAVRLKEAFGLAEVDWIADASGAGRRIDSLVERMRSGNVNLVIVLRAFTSHKAVAKVWSAEAPDCLRILADSYGVTQVRLGLERFLSREYSSA